MLLFKTRTGPSAIHGKGTFSEEFIQKGSPIWEFVPGIDKAYTKDEVQLLPEPTRSEILSLAHAYISNKTGRYILPGDNTSYINHSPTPNIIDSDGRKHGEEINITARDIHPGDELTVDYHKFDEPITFEIR